MATFNDNMFDWARKRKAAAIEIEAMAARCKEWFIELGYTELLPLAKQAMAERGRWKIVAQVHAAIFGGEFRNDQGEQVVYDGLDAITYEEMAEALEAAKEGHLGVRECIRTRRAFDQLSEKSGAFDANSYDF